jgi:hypothetical protein
MPKLGKEIRMAKRNSMPGQESKLVGFTRGGMVVGGRSPKPKSASGRNYGAGEIAALGVAGGLTGLVGAAVVSGIRQGFGHGADRFKKTK